MTAIRWSSVACGPGMTLCALILTGCASIGEPSPDTPISRGREVAVAACSSCHTIDDSGSSRVSGAPGFSDAGLRHTASLPGRLMSLTRAGHYAMPPLNLTSQQVDDLLAYLERNDAAK